MKSKFCKTKVNNKKKSQFCKHFYNFFALIYIENEFCNLTPAKLQKIINLLGVKK